MADQKSEDIAWQMKVTSRATRKNRLSRLERKEKPAIAAGADYQSAPPQKKTGNGGFEPELTKDVPYPGENALSNEERRRERELHEQKWKTDADYRSQVMREEAEKMFAAMQRNRSLTEQTLELQRQHEWHQQFSRRKTRGRGIDDPDMGR